MIRKFFPYIMAILLACSSDDSNIQIFVGENTNDAQFPSLLMSLEEGNSIDITITLDESLEAAGFIELEFSSTNAVYGDDYTTTPTATNGSLRLDINPGLTNVSFSITSITDQDTDDESIFIEMAESSENIEIDRNAVLNLNINDIDPEDQGETSDESLTVVTWNIEFFPMQSNTTIDLVKNIIEDVDADIYAVQEINDVSAFNTLIGQLDGYEGQLIDGSGSLDLGYIYKTAEFSSFSNLSIIFENDSDPFPRPPVVATATHVSGMEVTLINLHLKCCSNGSARRLNASNLLKEYVDDNMPNDAVIILGDFNDGLTGNSPFSNFINDGSNYLFADIDISSTENISQWSYPSWPSDLDHILISNELFENLESSNTLTLDNTISNYFSAVSDHRPVIAEFKN